MEVTTKDDKKATVTMGEMTGEVETGTIAEMVTEATRLDHFVPGASSLGAALALASNDDAPEFAVVRVEEGWSGSHRLWTGPVVESIVAQTNSLQPVGHLGHIPDNQIETSFPEPQTTWFAACTKKEPSKQAERMGEMVTTAYFAGYNLPGAKVRTYIKAKAVRGISWWGNGDSVRVPGRGIEVKDFTLKALDWARKGSEGMPSSSVVAVTGEMETNMAKELSQVTPDEFKAENPNGYALLVAQITADKDKTIGEMETKVTEGEDAKSLLAKACEAIGIDDPAKLLDAITDATTKIGAKAKETRDAAIARILKEKVPDDEKRALVERLIPQAVMGEMESNVAEAKDDEAADKIVSAALDAVFDKDTMIQNVIGEMTAPVVRRRDDISREGGNIDGALKTYGVERQRVTMGA